MNLRPKTEESHHPRYQNASRDHPGHTSFCREDRELAAALQPLAVKGRFKQDAGRPTNFTCMPNVMYKENYAPMENTYLSNE